MIWALDIFDPDQNLAQKAAQIIRQWIFDAHEDCPGSVIPVYILNVSQLRHSGQMNQALAESYKGAAEKSLAEYLNQFNLNFVTPSVILQFTSSVADSARLVCNFAASAQADVIAVSAHSGSSFSRFMTGSFVDALLLKATLPVLAIGSNAKNLSPAEKIFFPTDFSHHSERAFRRVVEIAKRIKAQVTLVHSVVHPIEPSIQSVMCLFGGTWIPMSSSFSPDINRHEKHAERWCLWAKKQGVLTHHVSESGGESAVSNLLNLASETNSAWIAMEDHSSALTAFLVGSSVRQVVRSSPCPVWVFHDKLSNFRFSSHLDPNEVAA